MTIEKKMADDRWRVTSESKSHHSSLITRHSAFTLLEMLVVIAIIGILAALAVPAIKNLGRSNISVSASRQLLDDIGRARQLAMSRRVTVYLVFVKTNFWLEFTPAQTALLAATNLVDKQLSGYIFAAHGAVGDQPGRHDWSYIGKWQSLPEGTFIQARKFSSSNNIVDSISGAFYPIAPFNYSTNIPLPTATNFNGAMRVPYIAFNSLGQLTFDGVNMADRDEFIPLAQGSVSYSLDPTTKTPFVPPITSPLLPGDITENPLGNSTGISYNIVQIDRLTGRATLQYHKLP